jgi:4-phytase/acid phosphatase
VNDQLWRHGLVEGFVRAFYTTQTLEQMRGEAPPITKHPPVRVPVFLPGCSRGDMSFSWTEFESTL